MSNNWDQFPANNQNSENNGAFPKKSGLLRDYRLQPQQPPTQSVQPPSPAPMAPPTGSLPPGQYTVSGPLHPSNFAPPVTSQPGAPQQGYPSQPASPYPPRSAAFSQQWLANTFQTVRRWTGKVASIAANQVARPGTYAGVDGPGPRPQPPQYMVPYRPSGPISNPGLTPRPQSLPWKRSLALRLTMHRRHRRERHVGITPMQIATYVGIAFLTLIVILLSSGSAYAYSYYQSQQYKLNGIASKQISQTTRIYDRNGILLDELYDQGDSNGLGGGRRTPISYDDVPTVMQYAMTSAEDPTFWTNSGIDPNGILRAVSKAGAVGGSTITQQLIKELTGEAARTIDRKIPEAALAIGLTQQYPKTKILEMYLNESPFGAQDLGVEAAVEDYFGLKLTCDPGFKTKCIPGITQLDYNQDTKKHDPILALARASLLAGLPQNPYTYDPTIQGHFQYALARQQYVLSQMVRYSTLDDPKSLLNGQVITLDMAQQAAALTAKMKFQGYVHQRKAPSFVDWVVTQLEDALGNGNRGAGALVLRKGGFNVRTTIDSELETYVEAAVKRHITQPERQRYVLNYAYPDGPLNSPAYNVNDSAAVVMDAKTGEVLAMDGSVDYNDGSLQVAGKYNAATSGRPPGSTFKPFVYATAFQKGWYPGMVVPDFQTYFPNGNPAGTATIDNQGQENKAIFDPHDYGGLYHNENSTVRIAIANSFNVPAVKAISFAGLDNVVNNVRLMGVTALDDDMNNRKTLPTSNPDYCVGTVDGCYGVSMALGPTAIPLVQMVGAYQTFANNGVHVQQPQGEQGILDIWDNYGHNLWHYDEAHPQTTQVFSQQVSYLMTSILTDEPSRVQEFYGDHDLSFADWEYDCATSARACQHQVSAKTGTSETQADKYGKTHISDNWTIGYTPNVVVGVWSGNANNEGMANGVVGITGAAPIWHSIIERIERGPAYCSALSYGVGLDDKMLPCGNFDYHYTNHTFAMPTGIVQSCVSNADGLQSQGGTNCDYMIDGEQPQQSGVANVNPNNNNNNGDNGNNNNNNGNNNNGNGNNGN